MTSYEAILFDLDGVVIDTHEAVTAFWNELAAAHRVRLSPADFQRDIYGCPMTHTLDLLFPMLGQAEREAVDARLQKYEVEMRYREVPGVVDLLRRLKQQRTPTALVTSAQGWKVDTVVKQLGLQELFTTRVLRSDVSRGKPHPEGYLLAAQRLGKRPQSCIVFEDAVSGVKAAVAAGSLCIGVRPPDTAPALIEAGACCSVPDFSQVAVQPPADSDGREPAGVDLRVGREASFRLSVSRTC